MNDIQRQGFPEMRDSGTTVESRAIEMEEDVAEDLWDVDGICTRVE
jgi:hypothetical protein